MPSKVKKPKAPKGLSELNAYANQAHERCVREGESLAAFWAERGYRVKVSVDPVFQIVDGKPTAAVVGFIVSSDMVNGLPRGYGSVVIPPPPKWRRVNVEEAGGLFHY